MPALLVYPPTSASCFSAITLGHVAFVAMFSTVFVKMYRIKEIFDVERLLVRQRLSDWDLLNRYLLPTYGALALYLLVWFLLDPPGPAHVQFEDRVFVHCASEGEVFSNLIVALEAYVPSTSTRCKRRCSQVM